MWVDILVSDEAMRALLDTCVRFVTTHNRLVLLVMLVLTGVMVVGIGQIETEEQTGEDIVPETAVSEAGDYIEEHYGQDESNLSTAAVYVHDEDGNVLSREALLGALAYQQDVRDEAAVAEPLVDSFSVATLVGTALATEQTPIEANGFGATDATLEQQQTALRAASEEEVGAVLEGLFGGEHSALGLLPDSYEPGTATAESHRMLFRFEGENGPPGDAQRVLFEEAGDRSMYFTLGEHAADEAGEQMTRNTMELVVPFALALVLGALAVTYRDPVDILLGLAGVIVSVIWMFGILGWLGIGAGMTMVIGPVLIAGLSIDFSFHVFNRYREQRGAHEGIRAPMARGVSSVGLALTLVVVTTSIGFLSNVVNPVDVIRNLGVGITLGVLSAFVVFMTLVPALKISIDGVLERVGVDRRRPPLGHGRYLRPVLGHAGVLARRAAPVVIVVALVVGSMGALAWTTLEEENFQQQGEPASDWKTQLPGPLAWEDPEFNRNQQYVQSAYLAVADGDGDRFQLLMQGEVTADGTLRAVHEVTDSPVFTGAQPSSDLRSPVTVIRSVAADEESFAATVDAADTTNDGVPDTDLAGVYDHLYEVDPEAATSVIERTDGEYRSLRIVGPAESAGFEDDRTDDIQAAAAALEADTGLRTTAVSQGLVMDEGLDTITSGILQVLVLALVAVSLALVVIFRRIHGSASAGVVTALPITLVVALVIGGMAVLDVPLTLNTALLMSLVVGLGIDYTIHLGDRFMQELERGHAGGDALETAVTGTGGALLGSALTSSAAFLALLVHPHPQIQSFGVLVVLALLAALFASVFVLPSLLAVWWRHRGRRSDRSHGRAVRQAGDD